MRLLLVLFGLNASLAFGQPYRGPVTSSLAGGGVAGVPAAEASLVNPALVPVYKRSSLDAAYRDGYLQDGQHRTGFALSAIDNSEDAVFPGALHYVRLRDTGRAEKPVNGEMWHLALGQQVDNFALGFGVYRVQYDIAGVRRLAEWNYSIGGVYMFASWLGVGYVVRNLAGVSSSVPLGLREDMNQALGVLAGLGEYARVRLDLERAERFNPNHKMVYAVSLETKTANLFSVRLGYRNDDLVHQRLWSAGLGFDGPRLQADYTFQKAQDHSSEALHSVDLRLPF